MRKGKILVGLRNNTLAFTFGSIARQRGYEVEEVSDLQGLLSGVEADDCCGCLMDLDFGGDGTSDIDSARQVYEIIKERNDFRFQAVYECFPVVDVALLNGIPAIEERDFCSYRFLS